MKTTCMTSGIHICKKNPENCDLYVELSDLNDKINSLNKEIDKNIKDFNKARKKNEFVCPPNYIMEANTDLWLRYYFENKGIEQAKQIINKHFEVEG